MRTKRWSAALALAAGVIAFAAPTALAKEFRVSNNGSCPNPDATSIQQAVNLAGPNDTVKVCPGTYQEYVRIEGPTKNGLKLESLAPLGATIQFPVLDPPSPPNALVLIRNAKNVTVRQFTVTGPFYTPNCVPSLDVHYGVRIDQGGDATIRDNHITNIRNVNPALYGCQDGVALLVGRAFESTTGTAVVDHNTIDNYQKNGPTIDNQGSSAIVKSNTIDGGGPSPIIARNGIQVGRGAEADVHSNQVSGNEYTGPGPPPASDATIDNDATGITVFSVTGGVRVHENTVSANDLGIEFDDAHRLEFSNNSSSDNRFDGIRAFSDTADNLIRNNKLSANGTHDCHDDSTGTGTLGTANTWRNNQGTSPGGDFPPGLCRKP